MTSKYSNPKGARERKSVNRSKKFQADFTGGPSHSMTWMNCFCHWSFPLPQSGRGLPSVWHLMWQWGVISWHCLKSWSGRSEGGNLSGCFREAGREAKSVWVPHLHGNLQGWDCGVNKAKPDIFFSQTHIVPDSQCSAIHKVGVTWCRSRNAPRSSAESTAALSEERCFSPQAKWVWEGGVITIKVTCQCGFTHVYFNALPCRLQAA